MLLSRMKRDRNKMAESLLNLTLEIIYQLTGEGYTVVKKPSSGRCQAPVYEGYGGAQSPILGPPPHPLIQEEINGQKILELTNKMLELLTGEVTLLGMLGHYTVTGGVGVMTVSLCCQVPIRCQDVAVYFSMEEWEYLEGHKDLYKEVMMEDHQPLTSPGNRHDYIHMDFHYLYVQNEFIPCLCFLQVDPVRGQHRRDVPVLFFHRMISFQETCSFLAHITTTAFAFSNQDKDLDDINVVAIEIKGEPYVSGDEEYEEDFPTVLIIQSLPFVVLTGLEMML
ncbi:uncharacterized protein LOC142189116 [Leptodactylus fuscus]|uniref:uncharacterized protein LOC142189116 n=1 Tax=Leptodactylus fuscus TaxID=238119 RepID=UPI003F4EABEB